MVTGAIQIPPDGQPIVLLPDHATVGGYPVAASVITADLGLIGQVGPGDRLRFELVSVDEARSIGREHRRDMVGRISGWYPVESGT
jgi:antagonist of KipI